MRYLSLKAINEKQLTTVDIINCILYSEVKGSKVIWIFLGVALLGLVIGAETSNHFLNQPEEKLKPIVTHSRSFSSAWTNYTRYVALFSSPR